MILFWIACLILAYVLLGLLTATAVGSKFDDDPMTVGATFFFWPCIWLILIIEWIGVAIIKATNR